MAAHLTLVTQTTGELALKISHAATGENSFDHLCRFNYYSVLWVLVPGTVRAGDAFELLETTAASLPISVMARLLLTPPSPADADLRTQAAALPHLPEGLKRHLFDH